MEEESTICPICVGCGETSLPISSMYTAKINSYLSFTKNGKEKWRIRLEICAKHVKSFLDEFGQDGEVVIFIMPKDKVIPENIQANETGGEQGA